MRSFGLGLSACIFCFATSSEVAAQAEVRFTEAPNYQSSMDCSAPNLKNTKYNTVKDGADGNYRALFGVFCGRDTALDRSYQISFSSEDGKYPGKVAHPIRVKIVTDKGVEESYGVAFFDTRQNRWTVVLGRGDTWAFWPEGTKTIGSGRGNFNGKNVRMHKGNKQTWALLTRVR